jgi:biopolymer transport protein ExbD
MGQFSRRLPGLALVATALMAAGPAMSQTISTSFPFQLYNRSGQDATITIENQGQSATARPGATGRVVSLPFVAYAKSSTAYYRIIIRADGQTLYNGVHEITYSYQKSGFSPALEQLFCLQANGGNLSNGRLAAPRITKQGLTCIYEFILT